MRTDILNQRHNIEKWISERQSKAFMCKQLKCKPITLEGYLQKMDLRYNGNVGGKGHKKSPYRKSAMHFIKTGAIIGSSHLRNKLIEDGLKKKECEMCGYSEWMNRPIPLELHHKDGNRFNNKLRNLQILCPTCHSLTPNHSKNSHS